MAFPPPPVTFRQRGSTFVERHDSPQAGPLPVAATRFYPGAQESLRPSLAGLSASTKSVIATANRSAFALSQSLATPFADPFVGRNGRDRRDGVLYTENKFSGQFFVCFISLRVIYFP